MVELWAISASVHETGAAVLINGQVEESLDL